MSRKEEIAELRRRAVEGDMDSQFDLAIAYAEGDGVPRNPRTALRWFERAAEQGDREAMTSVGYSLLNGEGIEPNHERAVEWFRRALELGDLDAPRYLASCLLYGEGVEQDIDEGLRMAEAGWADTGDAEYAYLLACAHDDLFQDEERSREWHSAAADLGHDESMVWMGYYHRYGFGVQRDLTKAVEWYRRAADKENDAGLANLAICYANGEGVRQNLERAFRLRQQAAEKGHMDSRLAVAACLIHGHGVQVDRPFGQTMLEELSQEEPAAALMLGELFYYGDALERDLVAAAQWLGRAAEADLPEALTFLGVMYWNGEGVEKDEAEARRMYERAAQLGDPHALYNLAVGYQEDGDHQRALSLLTEAAGAGHGPSACLLARRFIEPEDSGQPADPARGFAYLGPAMEEEDPEALYLAAECYRDGVGVELSLTKAMELFELAQIQGTDTRVERGILRRKLRGLE